MSSTELTELETREEKRKLAEISGIPNHIEVNEKTLEAYREEYSKKGLVIRTKDYPRDVFAAVKRAKKFDSIVDASQPILKKISAMCRMPVTVFNSNGVAEVKDALYYTGRYYGVDKAGTDIAAGFTEGYYKKPKLRFILTDPAHPYDSSTGERRGEYSEAGSTYEHYIFLPENKAERVKFLNDIIKNSPGTTAENLAYGGHLSYRQASPDNSHSGGHGGNFDWVQFCNLSLRELGEVRQTGYYKEDKTNILKDAKGRNVKYDDSTGKINPDK